MKVIGYISTFIVISFLSAIWNGYALTVLWGWFVVPQFGLQPLSIGYAVGLSLIVGYMTMVKPITDNEKSYGEKMLDGCLWSAFKPATALLFGWVVTLFL